MIGGCNPLGQSVNDTPSDSESGGSSVTVGTITVSDAPIYNFGNVEKNTVSSKTFTVSNTGDTTIALTPLTDGSLTLVAPFALAGGTCVITNSVAPRSSCTIIVSFSPTSVGSSTNPIRIEYVGGVANGSIMGTGVISVVSSGLRVNLDASLASGTTNFTDGTCADTTWTDLTSNGLNATLNGFSTCASGTDGWSGAGVAANPYRLSFDGVTDYVSFPSGMTSTLTTFSVSFWVKTTEVRSHATYWQRPALFCQGTSGDATGDFGITTQSGYLAMWSGLSSTDKEVTSTKFISDGAWHHIVAINNGTNLRLMVDGYDVGVSIPSGGALNATAFYLGGCNYNFVATNPLSQGEFATFQFYNRALTTEEAIQNCSSTSAKLASATCATYSSPPVAGPQLWFKADAISKADGETISVWADQSSNTMNATQFTGGAQPTYKTNILSGKPVLRFSGSNYLNHPYSSGAIANSVFAVVKRSGGAAGWQTVIQASAPNTALAVLMGARTGNSVNWGTYFGSILNSSYSVDGSWAALSSVSRSSADISIVTNGLEELVVGSGYHSDAWERRQIGGVNNGSETLTGDIAEILVYPFAVTDAQRKTVECYLGNKYGISINVAAGCAALYSAPSAPSGLSAVASSAWSMVVSWTASATADFTGYKLERCPDANNDGTCDSAMAQIATPGSSSTSYTDSGLTAGTYYLYRIKAYGIGGDSAYTSNASATTQADTSGGVGRGVLVTGTTLALNLNAPTANGGTTTHPDLSCTGGALTWTDISSSGANATLTSFASGSCGASSGWNGTGLVASPYRLMFNGTSDYLTLGNVIHPTTAYTLSAWVQTTKSGAAQPVINKFDSGGTNSFSLYIDSSGYPVCRYYQTNIGWWVPGTTTVTGVTVVNDGGWHHVVCVANNTTQKVYIDGAESASAAGPNVLQDSTAPLWIGKSSSNEYFRGGIAGVQIYTSALTAGEVSTNFNGFLADYIDTPAAPTALVVTAYATAARLDISWTASTSAATGAYKTSNVTSYIIERAPDVAGNPGAFAQIASVAKTVTSYVDTNLSAATKYHYRVKASHVGLSSAYTSTENGTAGTYPSGAINTTNLVLNFDAGSGGAANNPTSSCGSNTSTWYDISGQLNNGTLVNFGALTCGGVDGGGNDIAGWNGNGTVGDSHRLSFNGTSQYLNFGNTINPTSEYTLAAWVKTTRSAVQPIINKYNTGGAQSYEMYLDASGYPVCIYYQTNIGWWVPGATSVTGDTAVNDGDWHYVTCTAGAGVQTVYVDGESVGSAAAPNLLQTTTAELWIGKDSSGNYFGGALGGAQIYTRALTGAEVLSNMNAHIAAYHTAPAAPTGFTVTRNAATNRLDLNWTASVSTNVKYYKVERAPDVAGSAGAFAQIASVAKTVTSYVDTSTTAATTYHYRVKATFASLSSTYATAAGTAAGTYANVAVNTTNLVLNLDPSFSGAFNNPTAACGSTTYKWYDISGALNHATLTGYAALTCGSGWNGAGSGADPYRLDFNGTSNYLNFGDTINPTAAFTLGAWVKTVKAAKQPVINKYLTGGTNGYEMYLDAAGKPVCHYYQTNIGWWVPGEVTVTGPSAVNDGAWHYITCTAEASTMKVLVDGVAVASVAAPNLLQVSTGALWIGKNSSNEYFQGSMGGIHIYTRALSEAEVLSNFNGLTATFP